MGSRLGRGGHCVWQGGHCVQPAAGEKAGSPWVHHHLTQCMFLFVLSHTYPFHHIAWVRAHFWARMSWTGPHIDAIHSPPCQPRRTKPLSPSSTPHFSSNCAIWGHNMTLHFAIEVCWDYPACRVRGSGRGRAPRTRALARARFSSSRRAHCCPLVRLRRASDCTRARGMVRASFLRNSVP